MNRNEEKVVYEGVMEDMKDVEKKGLVAGLIRFTNNPVVRVAGFVIAIGASFLLGRMSMSPDSSYTYEESVEIETDIPN